VEVVWDFGLFEVVGDLGEKMDHFGGFGLVVVDFGYLVEGSGS
jgi:hypothetical protein